MKDSEKSFFKKVRNLKHIRSNSRSWAKKIKQLFSKRAGSVENTAIMEALLLHFTERRPGLLFHWVRRKTAAPMSFGNFNYQYAELSTVKRAATHKPKIPLASQI
jgi:hypothetical protein